MKKTIKNITGARPDQQDEEVGLKDPLADSWPLIRLSQESLCKDRLEGKRGLLQFKPDS